MTLGGEMGCSVGTTPARDLMTEIRKADIRDAARKIEEGARAVIHSSFIVEPESPSNEERQKEQKPIQSVS
jgi:hypothetical protein